MQANAPNIVLEQRTGGGRWHLDTGSTQLSCLRLPDPPDGRIDANEIQAVVSTLVAEKFKSKAFKIGLIVLGVFTVILLGAMFGLTWAVVAALKDTEVRTSGTQRLLWPLIGYWCLVHTQ